MIFLNSALIVEGDTNSWNSTTLSHVEELPNESDQSNEKEEGKRNGIETLSEDVIFVGGNI